MPNLAPVSAIIMYIKAWKIYNIKS